MENQTWLTLPENEARVAAARAKWAQITSRSYDERAQERSKVLKETAAEDGMSIVSFAEAQFIDLAIHKDTFLDDASVSRDVTSKDALYWKSRYEPITGIYMGSVYGGPPATLYATQDYYATLQPFVIDTESVKVPNMSLTTDPAQLGLREAGLRRQAEALRLAEEQYLVNTMLGQPIGTDLATSVSNYVSTGNPYNGKTVYVADPGVQSGTYETTNIISMASAAGFTPALHEAIVSQMILMKREPRTFHFATAGQPWRKLFRYGGVQLSVSSPLTGPGNTGLNQITPAMYEQVLSQKFASEGFVLSWWGMPIKFKGNNALPQGYGIITTDQPAAETINVSNLSVSVDFVKDPKNPYFSDHYEKRVKAIAVPDPWLRHFVVVNYGSTSGL